MQADRRGQRRQRVDRSVCGGPLDEFGDEGAGRRGANILWRSDLLDFAGIHYGHEIGELEGFILIVGHEDGRDAGAVVQRAQPHAKFLAHFRIERAERFVQQQHTRLDGERTCERDALALSPR